MFNLFKSKIELKKDNVIMSSIYLKSGTKLGSEIVVPKNFEVLVFHKDKLFHTLSSGKYKFEKKDFNKLIEYQQRKKPKLKHIKCVFHYINTTDQTLKIKFKKQYYIVTFNISNINNFVSLMLLHTYKVDNDYTINLLSEIFHELLTYNKGVYTNISSRPLNEYGINIISFLPENKKSSIFTMPISKNNNTDNIKELENTNQNLEDVENSDNEIINDTSINNTTNENTNTQETVENVNTDEDKTCPNCKYISKFSTTYCLRCGNKLK